jgi:hypothetical protein
MGVGRNHRRNTQFKKVVIFRGEHCILVMKVVRVVRDSIRL